MEADPVAFKITKLGNPTHAAGELSYFFENLATSFLGALENGVEFTVAVEVDDRSID